MNKGTLRRTPMKRRASRRERYVYGREIKGKPCAYCGAPAVNGDHVIPRSVLRKYNKKAAEDAPSIPEEWLEVVPSCFACNIRKKAQRLVPPSWAKRVPALNKFFGGVPWRVWQGGTDEPAFKEVHR